jgi:hypothetical protein
MTPTSTEVAFAMTFMSTEVAPTSAAVIPAFVAVMPTFVIGFVVTGPVRVRPVIIWFVVGFVVGFVVTGPVGIGFEIVIGGEDQPRRCAQQEPPSEVSGSIAVMPIKATSSLGRQA